MRRPRVGSDGCPPPRRIAWLSSSERPAAVVTSGPKDNHACRRAARFFAERGFQCVTHATGDRGVREALDAYASVPAPRLGLHRIEPIETLQPEDLPRFAAEGVVASMQAQHMMWLSADRSDNWSRRLGAERCGRAFLIRSLLESGATVALRSDWPVARYDPREGMAAARLRRPPLHPERPAYDDQALSGVQALEGYTTRAAPRSATTNGWGGSARVSRPTSP